MRFASTRTGFAWVTVALLGCSSNSSSTPSNGTSSGSNGSSGVGSSSGSGGSSGGVEASGSGFSVSGAATSGASSSGTSGPASGTPMATSGGEDEGGTGPTSDGGAKGDGETVAADYPSGPFCTPAGSMGHLSAGCVLPNVTWMGYADESGTALASTEPYAAYSLGDVYADARKSGKRYAMINVAEFDCPGCQQSATLLGTVDDAGVSAGASVEQAGGIVIEVLETNGFADSPTQ